MTPAQIKHEIVDILDYKMDEWTSFDKVTMIYLDQDSRLITEPKERRLKFNSDDGTISICDGVTKKGTFIPNITASDGSYGVCHSIRPEIIGGFIRTSVMMENGRISNV